MNWKRVFLFIVCLGAFNIVVLFFFISTPKDDRLMQQKYQAPASNKFSSDVRPVDAEAVLNISGIDKNVADIINKIVAAESDFFPDWYWSASMGKLSRRLNVKKRKAGAVVLRFNNNKGMANTGMWAIVDSHIRQYSLYDPDDIAVNALLRDMATLPIEETRTNNEGTQLKLDVKFKGGGCAVLKPMRDLHGSSYPQFCPGTFGRRFKIPCPILGYYRVPPTVGRHVNIISELLPVFPESFRKTVYTSDDGRVCFYGQCAQLCRKSMPFCGSPNTVEVSLMYFLPSASYANATLLSFWNPWKRERKGQVIPEWVSVEYLCSQTRHEYSKGNTLPLELLDVRYFDSLIDNIDRHNFVIYDGFNNDTVPILFDNGRTFGNPKFDNILHALIQKNSRCCLIKKTTLLKYLNVFLGQASLSELMRNSLRSDPVDPVLLEDELTALDRRVNRTILHIKNCLEEHSIDDVIINDIF